MPTTTTLASRPDPAAAPVEASTAASTAAAWSWYVAPTAPSPWPGRVIGTPRWPSASSAGTTSRHADPSSHSPAMSSTSMS